MSLPRITIIVVTCLLAGCFNPIQRRTASAYAEGCRGFQVIGKWELARTHCDRAVHNAIRGKASEEQIAALWLEYGRTSGVTCAYDRAEYGLQEAFEISRDTGGPAHLAALELARLMMARQRPLEAVEHYETFWSLVPARWIDGDPIAAAEVFEEQANAYRQLGDSQRQADYRSRAQAIRADHPYAFANSTITPYGALCS